MERRAVLDHHAPARLLRSSCRSIVIGSCLALAACGAGARGGSLARGSTEGPSAPAGGDEVTFPDEAEARAAPPASEAVLAAEALLAEGRPREAAARLTAILAETPRDLRAHLDLGLAREMQDDPAGAEQAYRAALAVDAEFSEALNNLGALLRDQDRVEEAVRLLREAVRVRPAFASAQLNLGLALEDAGDDEGALRAYRAVIRLSPREPVSRTSLGLLLLRRGQRDQALIELRRAAPLAESRADLAALGAGLRQAGDPAMALRVLRQAVDAEESPAPPGLRAEVALAEFAAGDRAAAEAHLRELSGSYAPAFYLLGNALAAREAWREAESAYTEYLRRDPSGAHASDARARVTYVRSRMR